MRMFLVIAALCLCSAAPVEACGGLFARIGARRAERRAARLDYACAEARVQAACARPAPACQQYRVGFACGR